MARIGRTLGALGCVIVVTAALAACSAPESTPSVESAPAASTPTADAGRAAFEAAEATYRAYIDAYDAAVFADPSSFESIFALTADPVLSTDRKSLAEASAEQIVKSGQTKIEWFEDARKNPATIDYIIADVCLDVSETFAIDSEGNSVVAPDRVSRQVFRLGFVEDRSTQFGYLLRSREFLRGGESCGDR